MGTIPKPVRRAAPTLRDRALPRPGARQRRPAGGHRGARSPLGYGPSTPARFIAGTRASQAPDSPWTA